MPRVTDLLAGDGLIERVATGRDRTRPVGDLTREPLSFPAGRDLRLQNLARGDEGFLLALGYSTQRGYGRNHPFAGEIRFGEVEVEFVPPETRLRGAARPHRRHRVPDGQPVQRLGDGAAALHPRLRPGLRPERAQGDAMALVDRALRARELGEEIKAPAQDEEFVLSHSDNVQATGFVEHLKLPHYVDFQAELGLVRRLRAEFDATRPRHVQRGGGMNAPAYNFAYLDEQTKRMIRRAILKAIAIPGYQVPFASREMPMPYGWGTGGVQVTAAILGPDDVLKVIDQGADDTTNAVSIRKFFVKTAGVRTTTNTQEATIIQTRHRIPELPLGGTSDPGVPGADPRAAALSRAARDRDAPHARARGIRADAREALRGHRAPRPYRDDLRLSGARSTAATSWIRRRYRSSTIRR